MRKGLGKYWPFAVVLILIIMHIGFIFKQNESED